MMEQNGARLLTFAEAMQADYVYLEIRLHPNTRPECAILAPDKTGEVYALKRGFTGYLDKGEGYGVDWRCWSNPPTDAQRGTAWNE